MYIDFEDSRPDTPRVEGALSVREGVLISIIVHLLLLIAVLLVPDLLPESVRPTPVAAVNREPRQNPRFVFMQPRVDISKPQPRPDVDASDQDRRMSTIAPPPKPENPLPFARGNSREREEAEIAPPNRGNAPEPSVAQGTPNADAEGQMAANDPSRSMMRLPDTPNAAPGLRLGETGTKGALGNALRNLQRYVQHQSFDNPTGKRRLAGAHPVRQQGGRLRSLAAPLRRAGEAQLVRAAGGDDHEGARRHHLQHPSQRRDHRHRGEAAVEHRVVQPRGGQRADELESRRSRCPRNIRRTRRSSR